MIPKNGFLAVVWVPLLLALTLDSGVEATKVVLAADPCPSGWTYITRLNSCYLLPQVILPFAQAVDYCQNVTKGEIVTIKSDDEYTQLMGLMSKHSSGGLYPFWTGLVSYFWYPYWQWHDGTSMSYKHWRNNVTVPKDTSNNTCIAWRTIAGDDGWVPMSCKYSQPFICKQASRNCPTVIRNNATEGNVTSPNYPDPYPLDSNCFYHITVPEGHVIQVHFDLFDIDLMDYITLYNGPDQTANGMEKLYGDDWLLVLMYYWETTGNTLTLQFSTSDWSYYGPGEGFIAHYVTRELPKPTPLDPTGGTLTSPNYPSNYNNSLELLYVVNAPAGMVIEVVITDFVLEKSYDWLTFFDGPTDDAPVLLDWAGDHTADLPKTITTTSNALFILFDTDGVTTAKGFSLTYRSVPSA